MEKTKQLTAEDIKVYILDWKQMEADITESVLKEGVPASDGATKTYDKGTTFELRGEMCIVEEPHLAFIDDECCGYDGTANKYQLGVYSKREKIDKKGNKSYTCSMLPSFSVHYTKEELDEYKTGDTKTLKEFMADRYNYNTRIIGNLQAMLEYFNTGKFPDWRR